MLKNNIIKSIGQKNYLKYHRKKILNFLKYSSSIEFNVKEIINNKDFKGSDKMLKSKIPSYYASKHSGFTSLAEFFDGKPIVELSSQVSEARRNFKVKPASWFKTEDAFLILEKAKQMGATKIIDPFHGWGSRLIASKMVGIPYVGIDKNPLLHRELKDLFPCSEIYCEDAFSFDYSKVDFDFVFTCPPYWKCEDYGYQLSYSKYYSSFLNGLVDLIIKLSEKANFQFISLESFTIGNKKYLFDQDFKILVEKAGLSVQEVVYREMKRSFNSDTRKLKYFIIWRD